MTPSNIAPAETARSGLAALDRVRRAHPNKIATGISLLIYTAISQAILAGEAPVRLRLDLSPLLQSPMVLQAHVAGALTTFVIGCALLAGVKGRAMHRTLGYVWIAAMAITAISSFFLKSVNPGSFSFIHALSAWTMIVLPMGLAAARRRDIAAHRKHMTGMFVGGLAIAGLFSFLPGRLMWHLFFTV